MDTLVVAVVVVALLLFTIDHSHCSNLHRRSHSQSSSLCAELIKPSGYPCTEHTVETKDGYLLGLQRVSSSSSRGGDKNVKPIGPPVLLQHGLFMAGDAWFLNSNKQSLGFILADQGFDVWVGNVRGTHWSHGHTTLSVKEKDFWDWSWQELALYDLAEMINFVYSMTNSKIFYVGHSQGTIMALAAFTQPEIVDMVEAAALLCPISYLGHISSQFVLRLVGMHLDQMLIAMGIHQLNFRSDFSVHIVDSICDDERKNCCFNRSRIDFYLDYEPHPTSSKNLKHLFQMIRKGRFAMYDYGLLGNLKQYGHIQPPTFDVTSISKSLPLWMGYGGNDSLADVSDFKHTLEDLKSTPELLYLDSYGHLDFILSTKANEDVYCNIIKFFGSRGSSGMSTSF
ncbi:Lipase [Thalictrum thalictroides]|uniref:Lipase n=1 Tax=Thalictrum thalictroides TaxID=46969 RepID=A0A7J6XFV3_THATH|nr:Lipase [Thalictrum thalictroides]